jgi:transcriptional regulator with XRE-family HTH domain
MRIVSLYAMKTKAYTSLQDWMERTGTTQAELARRAAMPQSQLSQLLKGSRRCSIVKALALSKVTGVPVEKLVEWPKIRVRRSFLEVA